MKIGMPQNNPFEEFGGNAVETKPTTTNDPFAEFGGKTIPLKKKVESNTKTTSTESTSPLSPPTTVSSTPTTEGEKSIEGEPLRSVDLLKPFSTPVGEAPFAFPKVDDEALKEKVTDNVKKIYEDNGYQWTKPMQVIGDAGEVKGQLTTEKVNDFLEGMKNFVKNDPLISNPIAQTAAESYLGSVQMFNQGTEEIQNAKNPAKALHDKDYWGAFELPAAIIKTGFGAASLASPNLIAFNAGTLGAEKVLPSDIVSYALSPVQTIREKGGMIAANFGGKVRIFDIGGDEKKGAAEMADLLWQILVFHGANELAGKVLHNVPLTASEATETKKYLDEHLQKVEPLDRAAAKKVPEDLPDETKAKVIPLVAEKQKIEVQKENTDEAFHPQLEAKKEAITNQINQELNPRPLESELLKKEAKLIEQESKAHDKVLDKMDELKEKGTPFNESEGLKTLKQKEKDHSSHLKQVQDAIQKRSPEGQISHPIEGGENLTESGQGIRPSEQGNETPETQPKEEIKEPSIEQQFADIQKGDIVTFEYGSESEVPDVFKDKISSVSTVNGKKTVRVSVPKSLADYELKKSETPPKEEVVSKKVEETVLADKENEKDIVPMKGQEFKRVPNSKEELQKKVEPEKFSEWEQAAKSSKDFGDFIEKINNGKFDAHDNPVADLYHYLFDALYHEGDVPYREQLGDFERSLDRSLSKKYSQKQLDNMSVKQKSLEVNGKKYTDLLSENLDVGFNGFQKHIYELLKSDVHESRTKAKTESETLLADKKEGGDIAGVKDNSDLVDYLTEQAKEKGKMIFGQGAKTLLEYAKDPEKMIAKYKYPKETTDKFDAALQKIRERTQAKESVEPIGEGEKSILNQETDLLGDEKRLWMSNKETRDQIIKRVIKNVEKNEKQNISEQGIVSEGHWDKSGYKTELRKSADGKYSFYLTDWTGGNRELPKLTKAKLNKPIATFDNLRDAVEYSLDQTGIKENDHTESIKEALSDTKSLGKDKNGKFVEYPSRFHQAIAEGRMTANDAKTIIESANLEVPKEILDQAKSESKPSPIVEKKGESEQKTKPQENVNESKQDVGQKEKPTISGEGEKAKTEKTARQIAKEERLKAKARLDELKTPKGSLGIAVDPKEKAERLLDYHKALVKEAKELIREGIKTVEDFAKEIGEELTVAVRKAWEEAVGERKPIEDAEKLGYDEYLESNRSTGITHAQTDEAARSLGLPEYEKSPETIAEWDAEAQVRIENGEMPELIRKLEKGDQPSPVETRMMAKYAADLMAKIDKDPSQANIDRYRDFKYLSDVVAGRQWGQVGRARQGQEPIMENVANMYLDKMNDLGVDELTEGQKTALQKKHDEYLKLKAEAEAKIKEADEKMAKLNAEKEIAKEKAKSAAKPREKKTHADYVAERKTYIETAREKLKKLRSEQQIAIVPYARELIAIAPEVGKMVKSLVNEGIDKLDDIVKAIHNEFKGDIKGLTEKDIHDIIAGEYTKKHPTKAALELQVKDLRDEAKLINQLEALQKGDTPKSEKIAIERNQRIKELQDQIKDFKKEKADAEKKAEEARKTAEKEVIKENYSPERKALEAVKKKNFEQIQKIKKDLAEGNFEKAPKTPFLDNRELRVKYPELWKQTMDAIAAREDAQHEYEVGRIRDQMSKRSVGEKIMDVGKGVVATAKALRQGIDDSAVFVQNIRALISHPKSALKALPGHLKDFASEKSYTRWLTDLHNHHFAWDLIHKSGLDITDPKSLRQQGREEPFSYNLLDKTFEVKGKKYNIGKNTVRPFERMFTSLGNRLRADAFLRMSEKFYNQGKTFETHPEEFKSLARALNNETGRGKIADGLDGIAKVIPIWSPRLLTSYINTLGISDIAFALDWLKGADKPKRGYYASMTPRMRTYAAASFAKHVGIVLSVMGLASLWGWKPDLHPTSATFGTIEKDGKTYNMFGGYNALVKLIAQFTTGKVTRNGITEKLDAAKWAGLPLHFIRGKLTPIAGTATDIAWGTIKNRRLSAINYLGQEVPMSQELLQNVTPLSVDGIANGVKNEGLTSLFTTGLPSFLGININYEADFKQSVPNEIKVGIMTKELTEKQHQEYQDYYDAYKERYINNLESLPDYISADDENKQLMRSMTNSMIKTDAENKMRELYPNIFKETVRERNERLKHEKEKEKMKNKIRKESPHSENTPTE